MADMAICEIDTLTGTFLSSDAPPCGEGTSETGLEICRR